MAIFRNLNINKIPVAMMETPGKIYFEGQAHDASTLTPLFNDTFTMNQGSEIVRSATPLIGMNARNAMVFQGGASQVHDMTVFDCNQGIAKSAKQLAGKPNAVFIPSSDYYTVAPVSNTYMDITSGERISQIAATGVTNDGPSVVLHEGADEIIFMQHVNSGGGNASNNKAWAVYKINKNTGVTALLLDGGITYSGYSGSCQMVHESDFGLFFTSYHTSNTNVTNATFGSFHVLNKSATTTQVFTLPEIEVAVNKPCYRPTKAISLDANTRMVYMPVCSGAASGDLFKFNTLTFSASESAAPVVGSITPTGASAMPGAAPNTAGALIRAMTFEANGFHYITITVLQPTALAFVENANYIHVYKAPVSDPTAVSYVSSTRLKTSAKAHIAMPLDDQCNKMVVSYWGGGMEFASWNLGAEQYVLASDSPVNAVFLAMDQTGRLWINDESATSSLHMFGPTVSNTIKFGFENRNLKYTGSVIDTNIVVSAYNFTGTRIANNITIQIDSQSAEFSDGSKSMTITTSADGDILVPIKVTGAGFIQVLANLAM